MTGRGPLREALERIATALADRTERERFLLAVLGAAAGLALLYLLIWSPLSAVRNGYLAAITRQDALALRLSTMPFDAVAQPDDPRAPAVIVSGSAGVAGLTIRRLEPAADRVRVVLEDADFGLVLAWIDGLDRDAGLRVVEIDITRRPSPGTVSATLTLRR